MLSIRPSTREDIPRIMDLFEYAKGIMRGSGNMHQWVDGYPQVEVALRDLELGHSFVVESCGQVVGTFAFIPGVEPTYDKIYEGEWLSSGPYATIHRIASTPDSHGVAKACFEWCKAQCPNLRVDTHRDNLIMQKVVLEFGFKYCGIIYLANGDERLAYQLPVAD